MGGFELPKPWCGLRDFQSRALDQLGDISMLSSKNCRASVASLTRRNYVNIKKTDLQLFFICFRAFAERMRRDFQTKGAKILRAKSPRTAPLKSGGETSIVWACPKFWVLKYIFFLIYFTDVRRCTQAGRRGAPAKGVGRATGARVQISSSPPFKKAVVFAPCSKGQLQKGDGVIRLGYTVFPFVVRFYATLEAPFRISSIAAMISFSSGTVMIPAARKWIVIGTCFFPSAPTTLLKTSIFFISVFTSVGVSSVMSVHLRMLSRKTLRLAVSSFAVWTSVSESRIN